MKLAHTIAMLWMVASAFLTGQTTVAYEGFEYLKGGCLAGGATGSGWSGAWAEAGEGGSAASELIIGPGSFPVPPGSPATAGHHADLNQQTGDRRITRRMSGSLGGGTALEEHSFSIVLDFGPGLGVDYAGIEMSHSEGGPVVFIGKPPGAGPGNPGIIGMDIYGQGFTGTGASGSGQKHLRVHWSPNPNGPENLILIVSDAASGAILGSASRSAEVNFNQVTLIARRDLAAGGAIPAFDEFRATTGAAQTRMLSVASVNPESGVSITISPADINGADTGNTAFERVYPYGTSVSLTAPSSAAGNAFSKWTLGGADYSTRRTITLAMTENRALTAVFLAPPPTVHTLSISSAGTDEPATIGVSPADKDGLSDGVAPFSRSYIEGTLVSLSAPSAVAGADFERWMVNGAMLSENPSVEVTMNAAIQITAIYDYPLDESITAISVDSEGAHLTWSGVGGRTYIVEASDDLEEFTPVSGEIPAEGEGRTSCDFVVPMNPDFPKRFFRIKIIDP